MSGRIYLVMMVVSVASFFALGTLFRALLKSIPSWSSQLRDETVRHWDTVQSTVQGTAAAVPNALLDIPRAQPSTQG